LVDDQEDERPNDEDFEESEAVGRRVGGGSRSRSVSRQLLQPEPDENDENVDDDEEDNEGI
jgi:hypothetical protein